ncbi:MAG: glycoside hydrolase family 5 protein, partial [Planctomycetota bacterium]
MPYAQIAGAIVVLLSWCLSASGQPGQPTIQRLPPADMAVVSLLGPGVNFGNMLEGPEEGAWGFFVEERFFDAAVDSGMKHIRLPVSWTHHTAASPPYTIDPVFMDRVEWCVDQALARGLRIIVNNHHYDELHADPLAESARSLAIWRQVAERFADRPNRTVFFEVLNEPHGAFNDNPALWDVHLAEALGVIRESNPGRWVLAGPVRWNSIAALDSFNPPDDPRLMLSVHHYEPFEFTHQGAEWVDPSPPVGTDWTGNEHVIASPWQNWSWDTLVGPADRGLSI